MKKLSHLLLFIISVVILFSCNKDNISGSEEEQIESYITSKNLKVTEKTSSGLRYIRTADGTGVAVKSGQTISVKYAGRLLTDKQFDAGTFNFKLGSGGAIAGFDEGIAKMKIGEKATLIFPSAVGYGAMGSGSIPPNAPLVFDIEVISAK